LIFKEFSFSEQQLSNKFYFFLSFFINDDVKNCVLQSHCRSKYSTQNKYRLSTGYVTIHSAQIGGLFSTLALHLVKYLWTYPKIGFAIEYGSEKITQMQVINGSSFTLRGVGAYLSIENDPKDIVKLNVNKRVGESNRQRIGNARIRWDLPPR
jgi:hypothetical protein